MNEVEILAYLLMVCSVNDGFLINIFFLFFSKKCGGFHEVSSGFPDNLSLADHLVCLYVGATEGTQMVSA